MKKIILLFSILILISGCSFSFIGNKTEEGDVIVDKDIEIVQEPQYKVEAFEVEDGDTFATLMEKCGLGYSEMLDILESTSSTYDFTSIRVGRPFRVFKNDLGEVVKMEYEKDSEEIIEVNFENDECSAQVVPIEYSIETSVISGTVSSSLWLSGLEVGMPEELIIEFADVFAWTVDFAVEVQKGDSFKVLYEKRFRDGEYTGVGRVLAGEFVNSGRVSKGYLFENEEGQPAYFNEEGEAMIKQFLKAPLKYKYISSGYTYARFHPVTQRSAPHLAIDYAASIGTPIMAVGDGTVMQAGWNGGFGNYIDIHHNDTYSTQYAHLSAYAKGIKRGTKVIQGQVIGYVGSTGWSTGPHLHYQIKKYGSLVNPLKIDLPPGDPVSEERQEEFEKVVEKYDGMF